MVVGVATPKFWDRIVGIVGSPVNFTISYNVQECGTNYEDTFQSGDFSEIEIFVRIK